MTDLIESCGRVRVAEHLFVELCNDAQHGCISTKSDIVLRACMSQGRKEAKVN